MSESSKKNFFFFFSIVHPYYTIKKKKERTKERSAFANVDRIFLLSFFVSRVIHFDEIRENFHTIYFSIDNRYYEE